MVRRNNKNYGAQSDVGTLWTYINTANGGPIPQGCTTPGVLAFPMIFWRRKPLRKSSLSRNPGTDSYPLNPYFFESAHHLHQVWRLKSLNQAADKHEDASPTTLPPVPTSLIPWRVTGRASVAVMILAYVSFHFTWDSCELTGCASILINGRENVICAYRFLYERCCMEY